MQRMGPLLCFWTGGIRRAEQARLRWSLAPPRGERARDCAARSASRPPPVRRIPPSCGNRRGGPMQRMGPLLCFWTGGIRRAEQARLRWSLAPPRGERARDCAARSASRPPPVRRIPPSALLLDRWDSKGGTENAAVRHFPALGASPRPGGAPSRWSLAPPRGERAREQIRPAGGCPAGAARRAAAPCAQTSISLPANPLLLPLHIISGVTCKSTREPSTAFTAMKSRSGSPSPRSSS